MDIHTAAHYMRSGYRIRRASWDPESWISEEAMRRYPVTFVLRDLLADDWEVITQGIVKDFPLTYADEVDAED